MTTLVKLQIFIENKNMTERHYVICNMQLFSSENAEGLRMPPSHVSFCEHKFNKALLMEY